MSYTVTCPSCHEKNPGYLLTCQKCQTSLIGLPREEYPLVRSKPLIQETTSLPKPMKPSEESLAASLFLLLAKTFGMACIIGIIVSIVGWRYLNWNSSRQLSDGLFWTAAVLAFLAHAVYRGESHGRKVMLTAFYVQPTGSMSAWERTKRWMADAKDNHRVAFHFFLVILYLIGFSALIWILF